MIKHRSLWLVFILFSCHPNTSEYVSSAKLSLENNQFEKTISIVNDAIKHYPENADFYLYRGVANFELENFEAAINDFTLASHFDSTNYKSYYNLGNCYFSTGNFEQSMVYFEKAISLNPKVPEIYINLGSAYFEIENYDESLQQFDFALQLDSNSYLANFNAARSLIMKEDFKKAEPLLLHCISIDPANGESYYFLAYVYYILDREKEEYCLLLSKAKELGFQKTNPKLEEICN